MKKDIPKRKTPFLCILKRLSNTQQLFFISYTLEYSMIFCVAFFTFFKHHNVDTAQSFFLAYVAFFVVVACFYLAYNVYV